MSKHLERHDEVLAMSVQALAYAKKKAKVTDNDIPDENILSLSKTEYKAKEQNVMFALYSQVKKEHRVRPDNSQLKKLANSGELTIGGVELTYDRDSMSAYINGNPVYVEPLLDAGEKPKDSALLEYSAQRKTYLIESIVNQRAYIDYDHTGSIDALGTEVNSKYNARKAQESLRELEVDKDNINPEGVFKTSLTASQKVRFLQKKISEYRKTIQEKFVRFSSQESDEITKAERELHQKKIAKGLADGTISSAQAIMSAPEHKISEDHEFLKRSFEGLDDKQPFPLGHLKEVPKGYDTFKEVLDDLLEPRYDFGDNDMSILAKQYLTFKDTVDNLPDKPDVDFSKGVDSNKFYVTTHHNLGSSIRESKSAVMTADGKYHGVNRGDFGLPAQTQLTKRITDYSAIVVSRGAVATGAFQKMVDDNESLKGNVLVVDALTDRNISDVISNLREHSNTPIAVYTDNNSVKKGLEATNDNRINVSLSSDNTWAETAVNSLKNGDFDELARDFAIDMSVTASLINAPRLKAEPAQPVQQQQSVSNDNDKPEPPNNENNSINRRGM